MSVTIDITPAVAAYFLGIKEVIESFPSDVEDILGPFTEQEHNEIAAFARQLSIIEKYRVVE